MFSVKEVSPSSGLQIQNKYNENQISCFLDHKPPTALCSVLHFVEITPKLCWRVSQKVISLDIFDKTEATYESLVRNTTDEAEIILLKNY